MTARILVVTGTRADFGLWEPVLEELAGRGPDVDVQLVVMGMHLDPRFGMTVDHVRRSGVRIAGEVPCVPESDTSTAMAIGLGEALTGVAPVIAAQRPDWLMVLGDRGEQLAAALAALHEQVPVAHLHGGERTLGAIDDVFRDVVSRIAHLHLVATAAARDRLLTLGEEGWRIHHTGGPGIDALRDAQRDTSSGARSRYGLPPSGPYLLVIVHPETAGGTTPPVELVQAVVGGALASGLPIVAVWPNADAGGREIAARLEDERASLVALEASMPRADFLALLAGATAIVGNSSSGIIEAPFLRVPAVNVGRRQEGRQRGDNVVDAAPTAEAVAAAIAATRDPAFRARLSGRSPYGDGHAAPRIVDAVLSATGDPRLMEKRAL